MEELISSVCDRASTEDKSPSQSRFASMVMTVPGDFFAQKLASHDCVKAYVAAVASANKYVLTQSYLSVLKRGQKEAQNYARAVKPVPRNVLVENRVDPKTLVLGLEDVLVHICTTKPEKYDAELPVMKDGLLLGKVNSDVTKILDIRADTTVYVRVPGLRAAEVRAGNIFQRLRPLLPACGRLHRAQPEVLRTSGLRELRGV